MFRNKKRGYDSDSDDVESISEEGTSGSEYSPDDSGSDRGTLLSPVKRPPRKRVNPVAMKKTAKKQCNYNENCYRKNPDHFREFGHSHLEKIMSEYKGSGDFIIPQQFQFQKSVIEEQLKILKTYSIYSSGASPTLAQANTSSHIPTQTTVANNNPTLVIPASPIVINDEEDSDVEIMNIVTRGTICENNARAANTPQLSNDFKTAENNKLPQEPTKNIQRPAEQVSNTKPQPKEDESSSNAPKKRIEDFFKVVAPRGKMDEKHKKAAPYFLFFTTITDSKTTHNQPLSITFQELLDHSLGNLSSSLQINFMVDIGWLLAQYYFAGYNNKPMTILYGEDLPDLKDINSRKPNVQAYSVPMQNIYGKHHTKMSLFCYDDDSVRVVISTANLYIDDWENRTQGLWISPKCPRLPDDYDIISGESPTGFKRSLINYLNSYNMPCLISFIEKVKHADFSAVNVFFVASVPGGHFDNQWGLSRIGNLLSKNCVIPQNELDRWTFIAQASSIGSYGADPKLWLTGDFQTNFCTSVNKSILSTKKAELKLIYPSLENVRNSHDNLLGGGCLPYQKSIHLKQTWLKTFLQEWSAVHSARNQAMPHIKSYLRMSPDTTKAAYFLLTSSNISKSAWGVFNKGNRALRINSYEVGVLFLPKFVISADHFSLQLSDKDRIPIPYDLPPVPYDSDAEPWVMDYLR